MTGFKTARVLVLDDQPDQAMPVIHALGLLGIGAIYNSGAADAVYNEKLTGVRVMFVDMVLAEHGADANDPEACVGMVAEALGRLVEDSCYPVVVVCWTGHEKMTPAFQIALKKAFPKAKIDAVIVAEKSNFSKPEDLDALKKLISDALAAQSPVNVLYRWEQMVHDAATRTTGAITRLIQQFAGTDAAAWNRCGYELCAALALAERGLRLVQESETHVMKALFEALNPLLSDRLDHTTVPSDAELTDLGKRLLQTAKTELEQWNKGGKSADEARRRSEGIEFVRRNFATEISESKLNGLPTVPSEALSLLSSELRAALHTMLHISSNVAQSEICPGNIYFVERGSDNRKRMGDKLPNWQEIAEDTLYPYSGKLPENHFPVLLEFSAVCDFAQAKAKLPRLVSGFLVPEAAQNTMRHAAYLRSVGPLLLINVEKPVLRGVYHFVFNAHYLLGVDRQVVSQLIGVLRLRSAILAEVVAWISVHMSRPGSLRVGP